MKSFSSQLSAVVAKSDPENRTHWLPFWIHSLDAAGVIEQLAREWLPASIFDYLCAACGAEVLIPLLIFIALVHDIGKITFCFQSRIGDAAGFSPFSEFVVLPKSLPFKKISGTPHALASEAILLECGCPPGVASMAGSHHGKPTMLSDQVFDQLEDYAENYYDRNENLFRSLWSEWLDFALEYSGFDSIDDIPDIPEPAQVLICGMLIMADWIASNTAYFPLITCDENGKMADYPGRIDHAWKKLAFPEPWVSGARFGLSREDFYARFGFMPNSTQSEVIEAVNNTVSPGICILEAPMGLGKTEAALALTEILAARSGAGGLFFGMPTQATSNGIFKRLERWAEGIAEDDGAIHSIKLAHAAAELNDDYRAIFEGHSELCDESCGLIVHDWFSGRKQALLSDFVIGTVDQMLMAALKQKHVMLRHTGLAGKVVVVDECHAYDAYMSQYLDTAIKWLGVYKVPVVILSATLPVRRRTELVEAYLNINTLPDAEWMHSLAYPVLTFTDGGDVQQKALTYNGEHRSVAMKRITRDWVIKGVGYAVSRSGCAGVIVNTVKKAQEISEELRTEFPESEVIVMHAQFIMTERANREKLILERVGKNSTPDTRRGLIVVGTQVLEQSLDLDFDIMVTELCPMDLLLQRIGRLHRHDRKRPDGLENAECLVIDEQGDEFDGGSAAVYGEWLLMKTRAALPDKLTLPDDIPPLVNRVYDADDLSMFGSLTERMTKARNDHILENSKKKRDAENYLLGDPPEFDGDFAHMNTLDGWLDNSIQLGELGEQSGEMAVRDGDPSIDIIALRLCADGKVRLITDDIVVPTDRAPSREEALVAARQKLRLPAYFSKKWKIDDVINELENVTTRYFPGWRDSSLLKEELALIFDNELTAQIGGTVLRYDIENGLTYEKE